MRDRQSGLLDTNVFIHAHAQDDASDECRRFLVALEAGHIDAYLDPVILHELSYALPHYIKQMTRSDVADYLLMILGWEGVHGEKGVMVDSVERWRSTARLSFADAYLASLASVRGEPVFTKNIRDLEGQGVKVPNPLPN